MKSEPVIVDSKNDAYTKFWILSEVRTNPSKPQKFLSESRYFSDEQSAKDWCDFVKQKYKNKRNVFIVKI